MKQILTVCLLLVFVAGCTTQQQKSHFEEVQAHPDYNVGSFTTYRWAEDPVTVMGVLAGAETPQLRYRVKHVFNQLLKANGYQLVEEGDAELEVSALVGASEQQSYSQHVVDSQRYYDVQVRWTQENDFLRGAVSLLLINPDNKDIVWQGTVGENLHNNEGRGAGTLERFAGEIGRLLPASQ